MVSSRIGPEEFKTSLGPDEEPFMGPGRGRPGPRSFDPETQRCWSPARAVDFVDLHGPQPTYSPDSIREPRDADGMSQDGR
jgi:hypothetical protein